jgi:hypothetical protein
MSFWQEAGARDERRERGARQLTSSKEPARKGNSPPWKRDRLPSKGIFSFYIFIIKRIHPPVIVCVYKIKKNSLCR